MPDVTPTHPHRSTLPAEHQDLEVFTKPLFNQSGPALKRRFRLKNGKVDHVRLVKNLLWQDHGFILSGALEPVGGNIRSYWYQRIKPVLSRVGWRGDKLTRTYDTLIDQLADLVKADILAYRDFAFSDHNRSLRRIGGANGNVWLVAEKEGHWPLLEQLSHQLEVTAVALGGFPSLLSSEYMVDELQAQGPLTTPQHMFFVVDYDPSGRAIADSFIAQLQGRGLAAPITQTHLVEPDHMTLEQIGLHRFNVPGRQHKQRNLEWVAAGGGLERFGFGKYQGLQADAMPWPQLTDVFLKGAEPHLSVSADQVQRRASTHTLYRTLKDMLADRILAAHMTKEA